jgi:S1-C subfamily serine protease
LVDSDHPKELALDIQEYIMATSNILNRTIFIKAESYGSAFVIDIDNSEYIVTAKHLLPEEAPLKSIQIREYSTWATYPATEVGRARGETDIAVLKIEKRLVNGYLPVTPSITGLCLGQDVLFVGFPYKLEGDVGHLENGRPLGYVKKGTVSVLDSNNQPALVLDATNNVGFSGGPVVFIPPGGDPKDMRLAAIVSKFRIEELPVISPDGNDTGQTVYSNSGFLYAYNISHAVRIIRNQTATPII